MLRLATIGSIDDGKSPLIGRLLYDSKAIFEGQPESVERAGRDKGDDYVNLALLADGLRAEREQGITIDVAYRYFTTPKRKFVIADTPGHIQYVIRPQSSRYPDYRGYSGQVAGGMLKPGDEVIVLPSGSSSRVAAVDTARPRRVTGDMICRPHNAPPAMQDIDTMVCWMSEAPLHPGQKLPVKHTTRSVWTLVKEPLYRLDVNTLHRESDVDGLRLNDSGRVRLRTTLSLFCDDYRRNPTTGSFVLNEATNRTVGAGMIN